jgi:hypothetical protein
MKQKLIIVAALLFATGLHAALVEYTYTGKETDTGAGKQDTYSYSGIMIYDTVSSNVTFIDWRTDKTFHVGTATNFQYTTVTGPGSKNYTVITGSSSGTETNGLYHLNNYLISGGDDTLKIATGTSFKFPKSFSGSNNRSLSPDSNGQEWLSIWNETMSYGQTRTEADNNAGLSSEQVETATVIALEEKGYKEE